MPTVDVLVPTHNRASMLRQCLESIRNQTFQDFVVTIGDDCSSDGTPEVAREYCAVDNRFRYVRNTRNLGQWANVNGLMKRVTSPYVQVLHDDDWIEPGFCAELVPVLESSPGAGLVFCRSTVSQTGDEYPPELPTGGPTGKALLAPAKAFQWVLKWHMVPLSATVLRASVLNEIGPFAEEFMSSDWLMWLQLSARHGIAVVDAPLAHYRIHDMQMSTDRLRLCADTLRMLAFADDLPSLRDHQPELAEARFRVFRFHVLALKERTDARHDLMSLGTLYELLDSQYCIEAKRTVTLALVYASLPRWLKHTLLAKGTSLRGVAKTLFGFGASRGDDA